MTANDRMIEIDGEPDPETVKRLEANPLVVIMDFDRLENPDEALGRGLLGNAG
jgi:hypothetical protein